MTRPRLNLVSTEISYLVPWVFERGAGHYALRNVGREPLTAVTFMLFGSGVMPATVPSTLQAGECLELMIAGGDLARNTIGVVRWFRPDGREYLWRVSF